MGNPAWFNEMSNATVSVGARGLSDHCPLILKTGIVLPQANKPFQFFNFLMELDGYHSTVSEA